jgi:hypothetical protein
MDYRGIGFWMGYQMASVDIFGAVPEGISISCSISDRKTLYGLYKGTFISNKKNK